MVTLCIIITFFDTNLCTSYLSINLQLVAYTVNYGLGIKFDSWQYFWGIVKFNLLIKQGRMPAGYVNRRYCEGVYVVILSSDHWPTQ